ncbi:ATP-binding protein [Paraglaciecola chathamensis]|uniref:ATP-binding protein n=1 Tax=Paraglaciecola chathamensis TaxID=368405 RepID=UPI002700F113|nr:ATP-binding protein [Paraglaciecola chathamensis]MDO6839494.1 ATP-binding protein [Paraglaciecola chathamensis]
MLNEIKAILRNFPGLTGREIAKKIKKDKKDVNSYLSKNNDGLYKDDWKWYLKASETIEWNIECQSWLTCEKFEESYLNIGDLLGSAEPNVVISFPEDFKVLLIAGARIISLSNQLNHAGKQVTLNFKKCTHAIGYLNRLGCFDHIHKNIEVLPKRPKSSKAKQYKGNSKNIVEIGDIDLNAFNEDLPKELTAAFTHQVGDDYYMAAFTVFSELIGNVEEHSETPIPGFAALQLYSGKQKHIQTVISDHGRGLSNTLKANLSVHYPKLASTLNLDDIESDVSLIKKALTDGKLSRFGHNSDDKARGLGLKRSQDYALKYNAEITIRQESFLVKLIFSKGELVKSSCKKNLGIIAGTHICFDFILE